MEEKRKGKSLVILVILLVVVILELVGYICYDKGIILSTSENKVNENQSFDEKTDSNWEEISLNDSSFYQIYDELKNFTYDSSRGAGIEDFNNQELFMIAFSTADYDNDAFTQTSVDSFGNLKGKIDLNKVHINLKRIFGKDYSLDYSKLIGYAAYSSINMYNLKLDEYVLENFSCGFDVDSYNKNLNSLDITLVNGCGGTSGPSAKINARKIISAKKKDDIIVVEEKAIYYDSYYSENNVSYNIYADNTKQHYLGELSDSYDTIDTKEINVDSYLDKASTITHTFKLNKKTNKYYFVSSVIK